MEEFFKYTVQELNDTEDISTLIEKLEPKVMEVFNCALENKKYDLVRSMADCCTPIERILAIALYEQIVKNEYFFTRRGLDLIGLVCQDEIKVNGVKYCVDFLIAIDDLNRERREKIFIIECDGHEFHEKTKEQAAKDKKRDRDLLSSGHIVIHFSGSEIYNDSEKCAEEAFDIITNYFRSK